MSISCHTQLVTLTNVNAQSTMVRDFCTTTNKWHQSTALVWYDYLICAKMMTLTTLLRHSIYHDDDHQHKKDINAQSTL